MLFPDSTTSGNTTRGLLRSNNISPMDIYANQWALIIGINKYRDFPQLKYAVEDAKSMKTLLTTQYGFPEENILLLTVVVCIEAPSVARPVMEILYVVP